MTILQCRHCGGAIDSDTRCTQCRQCGALFPFQCVVCQKKLRSPFPVFEDERYLTLDCQPQPLCEEHFLRKCPDCQTWFQADENQGYFRCAGCAEKAQTGAIRPEWSDELPVAVELSTEREIARTSAPLAGGLDINILILGSAGCAFLVLMGWMLLGR